MNWLAAGLILAWVAILLLGVLVYQLILQNGRLLRRLEEVEKLGGSGASNGMFNSSPGLPVGIQAPDFDLADLTGGQASLSHWRGQRLLLVFSDPGCGFCQEMMPALAALSSDPAPGRPLPIILTGGDVETNRRIAEKHGLNTPVLLLEDTQVAKMYQVTGTPMGYLVDEEGVIASPLTAGSQELLILAGTPPGEEVAWGGSRRDGYSPPAHPDQDGLKPGTLAPIFRLPRLSGGELSLLEFRGRQVLLVFYDPECGPCNQLAPDLVRLQDNSPDLQIVFVSRGSPEANQARAAEFGLDFPIALQQDWEISRDYKVFATPSAYRIDEWGVTLAEVAVGAEPILALASAVVHGALDLPQSVKP